MDIALIFMLLALACFLLDTFGVSARINLTPLGLAFVVVSLLLGRGLG